MRAESVIVGVVVHDARAGYELVDDRIAAALRGNGTRGRQALCHCEARLWEEHDGESDEESAATAGSAVKRQRTGCPCCGAVRHKSDSVCAVYQASLKLLHTRSKSAIKLASEMYENGDFPDV